MKNKKLAALTISALLLTGSIFSLAASGQSETTSDNRPAYRYNRTANTGKSTVERPRYRMNYTIDRDKEISVTWEIQFTDNLHPILKADGKEYELMVPRYLVYNSGLKEGDKITVIGYQIKELDKDSDIELYITKAVIDGKTIDIEKEMGNYTMGRAGGKFNRDDRSTGNRRFDGAHRRAGRKGANKSNARGGRGYYNNTQNEKPNS